MSIPARDALARLREGNRRFVAGPGGHATPGGQATPDRHFNFTAEQRPFAVILGCADSRVPAEIVFDQGLGDLFVIRVAGNVVAPSLAGSAEYAAIRLDVRLIVVMGHSGCGAVEATLAEIRRPGAAFSPNLLTIADQIRPSVEEALLCNPGGTDDVILRQAVRANICASVDRLHSISGLLDRLTRDEGLWIIGAEYSLESGEVDFFDPKQI